MGCRDEALVVIYEFLIFKSCVLCSVAGSLVSQDRFSGKKRVCSS
jgi:hypothetical protein